MSTDASLTTQIETLANGLKLIEIHQPRLHTVNISLFIKTGSRFEKAHDNGLSHFLEHMIFRGTASHPTAFQLNQAFEKLGANINGSTTPDSTEYTVTLPVQSVITASSLLFEMMATPKFSEVETERKIITEEILEDFDENQQCIDIDALSRKRVWHNCSLGAPITGSVENVLKFQNDDLNRWYANNYTAPNMILCISGDITATSIRSHIRNCFSQLKNGTRRKIDPFAKDDDGKFSTQYLHVHKPGSQTQLRLAFATPGLLDQQYPVIEILLRLIDDGMSTPLHRRIFEDLALAYNIGAELEAYEDTGVLNIDAQASHENILAIAEESLRIIQNLKMGRFDADDVAKAKMRAMWDLESLSDFPGALNAWYGEQELYRSSRTPEQRIALMRDITAQHIIEMADRVFCKKNFFITTVGMQSSKQQRQLEKIDLDATA